VDKSEEYDRLRAVTHILKQKLILMMIKKWNGKDFGDLDGLEEMADDVIEIVAEMGNDGLE
jgi:hypothetical protein